MRATESPSGHLRNSITNLPPELLSIIFKFLHDDSIPIEREKDIIPSWMRMEGPEAPNLKSPTLFPYSLASVCLFWRNVLCSHPEFWTLIVLFVDSKPTPLVDASLFLEWSGKHHIDVFITRRDGLRHALHPDRHEKCQIDALFHILKPHLPRCRSLQVDAHLSSAFPIIHKIFNKILAPHLKSMELICDAHADDEADEESDGDPEDEFEPSLARLIIDGRNFCRRLEESIYWMDWRMGLTRLTISQYKAGETSLDQLKFEGLHFSTPKNEDLEWVFMIPFVHLEDVSAEFIVDLSKFASFDLLSVLRITRCPLPGLENFLSLPETLILEDIDSDVDLLGAISTWDGENLWLDGCRSFSNASLKALGRRRSLVGYPCSEMRRLLLHRLPKFSVSLLKKMVAKRNALDVEYDDPDWRTTTHFGPAISHLAVVQCGLGSLSTEDERWFRAHLVEFFWIP